MLTGPITLLDALFVAISSMLVVFSVLLILFVIVKLFPLFFRQAAPAASGREQEEDDTLVAVLTAAALMAAEGTVHCDPTVRSARRFRRKPGSAQAENPMARSCTYIRR